MYRIILLLCLLSNSNLLFSQHTRAEVLTGNQATGLLISLDERFSQESKFGFAGIVNVNMPHDKENGIYQYFIIQPRITYDLIGKKVNVFVGGFRSPVNYGPLVGLQTNFPFKNGILSILNQNKLVEDFTSEVMVIAEYRPKINEKLNLYSRIQVMYETDFQITPRNWLMFRLGFGYKKFQFGLGATFDQFRSNTVNFENYGVFVRTTF